VTVERTVDYELIHSIVTHPRIYPWISDDGTPPVDKCEIKRSDDIYYVLISEDNPAALFIFMPQNAVCYDFHVCVLPELWGRESVRAGRMAIHWMFEHSPARRIVGGVPTFNPLACHYALNLGMEKYGVNRKSYLHEGTLYDQNLYGISKEDV